MSDKLITLDLLKKFGGTCKTSFQEAPITVSGDSNIIIIVNTAGSEPGFYGGNYDKSRNNRSYRICR